MDKVEVHADRAARRRARVAPVTGVQEHLGLLQTRQTSRPSRGGTAHQGGGGPPQHNVNIERPRRRWHVAEAVAA